MGWHARSTHSPGSKSCRRVARFSSNSSILLQKSLLISDTASIRVGPFPYGRRPVSTPTFTLMVPAATTQWACPSELVPMKWLALRGSVILATALSSGAYEWDEGLLPGRGSICSEDSAACVAPGGDPGISSDKDDMSTARTKGGWAGGGSRKRRRRVGFSHEDVATDEYLRPYLQAFRYSLSVPREKDAADTAAREGVTAHSPADIWIPAAEEKREVIFPRPSVRQV